MNTSQTTKTLNDIYSENGISFLSDIQKELLSIIRILTSTTVLAYETNIILQESKDGMQPRAYSKLHNQIQEILDTLPSSRMIDEAIFNIEKICRLSNALLVDEISDKFAEEKSIHYTTKIGIVNQDFNSSEHLTP
jgi:hypothetical protein